jgi:hypothetical protein
MIDLQVELTPSQKADVHMQQNSVLLHVVKRLRLAGSDDLADGLFLYIGAVKERWRELDDEAWRILENGAVG